jgi:putative exporter of polyketide antibiotics
MENNNNLSDKLVRLVGTSREYIESKLELEVLKAADKIARTASLFAICLLASATAMLIIGLLCLGLAVWLNEYLNSSFAGYFIVAAGVLLVAMVLLLAGKRSIKKKIINSILKTIDHG